MSVAQSRGEGPRPQNLVLQLRRPTVTLPLSQNVTNSDSMGIGGVVVLNDLRTTVAATMSLSKAVRRSTRSAVVMRMPS